MNMTPFTRQIEECRNRWNRHTLKFVLAVARILSRARKAAKSERRWGEWILHETRISRPTVYRYLQVAEFTKANVSRMRHLETLSINKIFGLCRLPPFEAAKLLGDEKTRRLSEVEFKRRIRRLAPRKQGRLSTPNLIKAVNASLLRLEKVMHRWTFSRCALPAEVHSKVLSRLRSVLEGASRRGGTGRSAM